MPHLSPLVWGFMLWLVVFSCMLLVILSYWSYSMTFKFSGVGGSMENSGWNWR